MKLAVAVLMLCLCAGCASLPSLEGRPESRALADTSQTRIALATAPRAREHPGKTGIYPLPLATDAFAVRVVLANLAEKSLDAQYYIWHDDQTGLLLLGALRDAARRGVRVRLLVDDQNTKGFDALLAALERTGNAEVRLYNPFANRGARWLDYVNDFGRVNRRMHNKSFTVDGHVTVVGGRNIGNEYFGAGNEVPFRDLDVAAIGRAVEDVSAEFDLYWNSASAYPIAGLVPADKVDPAALDRRIAEAREDPVSSTYLAAVRDTPVVHQLLAGQLAFEWAQAVVVRDDPAKTLDPNPNREMLALAQVFDVTGPPAKSFDLISPYFVPGEKGTAGIADLARRGVRVRVLTNSLAGTDVAVVHSGYAKRRCDLARAGVRLYELKPSIATASLKGTGSSGSSSGSSRASLHAKTFALDDDRIFVGSFNFDLRSALLNTEMGLVIHSPTLARRLGATFDGMIVENAYSVRPRAEGDCVEWVEATAAGEKVYETEPGSSGLRRFWLALLMALPIDWLL